MNRLSITGADDVAERLLSSEYLKPDKVSVWQHENGHVFTAVCREASSGDVFFEVHYPCRMHGQYTGREVVYTLDPSLMVEQVALTGGDPTLLEGFADGHEGLSLSFLCDYSLLTKPVLMSVYDRKDLIAAIEDCCRQIGQISDNDFGESVISDCLEYQLAFQMEILLNMQKRFEVGVGDDLAGPLREFQTRAMRSVFVPSNPTFH